MTGLTIFLYLKYTHPKVIPLADFPSVTGNAVFCSFAIALFFTTTIFLGFKEGLNHKKNMLAGINGY